MHNTYRLPPLISPNARKTTRTKHGPKLGLHNAMIPPAPVMSCPVAWKMNWRVRPHSIIVGGMAAQAPGTTWTRFAPAFYLSFQLDNSKDTHSGFPDFFAFSSARRKVPSPKSESLGFVGTRNFTDVERHGPKPRS